jgi:iron complex outermembrane receptor protein
LKLVLRLSTSLDNPFNYGIYGRPLADGIGAGVYELSAWKAILGPA